ncbi:PilT protein-like protein [Caballeronia calidae]|uniref:PilT protein-like protein n=1 Tax=Caballeronia calidae TaxID=1777139 RepID=A0A158EE06_9BURK|nr:type II toxin-antitoxin system VapC family toxin [Caballeronia calidae]SAL05122.1 PilT protein-like protein [Caballeronia calidae]
MRLLIDTHIYLWSVMEDRRLSGDARERMRDAEKIFVSSASIWELSIKASRGKLEPRVEKVVGKVRQSGFLELKVTFEHAFVARELPLLHYDPFDRMLVAQAVSETMRFLTVDKQLRHYHPCVIPV